MIKKIMITWGKKALAFILDFFIVNFITNIVSIVILFGIERFWGQQGVNIFVEFHVSQVILTLVLLWYFFYVYQRQGISIGGKVVGVKYDFFWPWGSRENRCKRYLSPAERLKKDTILNVNVKDGRWVCPSCNEPNLGIYDACSNCGQEVEKI